MSDSVEAAKDAGEAKDSVAEIARETVKPARGAGRSKRPTEAMLKQVAANAQAPEPAEAPQASEPTRPLERGRSPAIFAPAAEERTTSARTGTAFSRETLLRPRNLRYAGIAACALVIGTAFGMMASPKGRSAESLAQVHAGLEAGRTEASRLNAEIERLGKSLAALRESSEAVRTESKTRGSNLNERFAKLEQGFEKKFAALGDKLEQSDREQGGRIAGLAAQVDKAEKRASQAAQQAERAATKPEPKAEARVEAKPEPKPEAKGDKAEKAEPTQTGSISEPKAKPETVDTWALREVYDGIALLEDRRRRLIEVAAGESVPGIGRVEAIERRGRSWVVVTKQGVITTQSW